MKITCQACAAKYTIADDKVLGKIVKIRCKKCGATIVVNGNDPTAATRQPEAPRFDYENQAGPEPWTVNVADGDQRTMTDAEIVSAYHEGVVTDETFCWKEGMDDWLPLQEIESLSQQCNATRAMVAPSDDEATKIRPSAPPPFGNRAARVSSVPPRSNGHAEPAPAAARRVGGRAPAADLFGSAAQAGGEEEVMTSAPAGMPKPHDDDGKLTGARNESSVLFSLNALTSKGGPGGAPMPSTSEASGLIDIRQLSNQIGLGDDKNGNKKRSRVDDIMNLGGGGAFAPSLGAPMLSAPALEEYAPPPNVPATAAAAGSAQPANRMVIIGAIGAGAIVILGALGVAVMLTRSKDDTVSKDKAVASASASAGASATPSASVAANASAAGSASSAPTEAPSGSVAAASTDTPSAPSASGSDQGNSGGSESPAPASEHAAPAARPAAAAPRPAPVAAAPAPAAGGSDQPFNMGEAKAKLGAIAGAVQACKKGDASGTGRVVVTFAPSGGVQSAVVSGAPFEGTPTGACVAGRFRGARVPAFSGSPFSVSKSFTIN